jgi:CheY-like chemotaxis protein
VHDAEAWIASGMPRALVLDIQLFAEDTWSLLADLKTRPSTRDLPVAVVTNVDDERKALALGADAYAPQPVHKEWLLGTLRRLTGRKHQVFIVDDDETARYVLRGLCRQLGLRPVEAMEGGEALQRVAAATPDAMFLDLVMPGMGGAEVLERLRADPSTAALPVVITTSKVLEPSEKQELESHGAVVLSKAQLSSTDAIGVLDAALRRAATVAGREGGAGHRPEAP